MMRQYELVDRVRRYNPHANEELLNRAYVYAMKAHGAQMRASGDPFFSHPLEVAAILTDLKLDDATIISAVLHDTIEDTASTREDIDRFFGPEIAQLVDGLTKLKKLDLVSKRATQAENFRKLLLAIADDVRVLMVKLADRLHNMRTLRFMPAEKQDRIAQETLDIYAPLAGRMGMQSMRDELEDLAFRALNPDAHAMITGRLDALRARNGTRIRTVEDELREQLAQRGIEAEVVGREKTAYSVFRKMERKTVAFEQLSDIFGFRVLVDSLASCYTALGVVHTKWPNVPGRFKDYISTPKQNDYRSLHTTVIGPGRQRVELQIRTKAMHDVAEFGIAAHSLYKDQRATDTVALTRESLAYRWLKHTVEMLAVGDSPEEFLEHTKLELFQDQVFCFTPGGRLIALPRGATPIDFAYAIHTGIGNEAVGAKINGRIAPLNSELQNGDEVEIARATGQVPPAAWESLVVTGKARAAIRRATREAMRAQFATLGRQMLVRAFERAGKVFSDEKLKPVLPRLARSSVEEVLAAVGRGEIHAGDAMKAVHPDFKEERRSGAAPNRNDPAWFGLDRGKSFRFQVPDKGGADDSESLPIRGPRSDLPVHFAPNGGAVPGDRIVGIVTEGEGVTIYPIQSPALSAFEDQPERWLDVRWDIDEDKKDYFPAEIVVTSINEPGSLGIIASVIGESGANIDEVRFVPRSPEFHDIVLGLQVWDLHHLNAIISQLRQKGVISKVERVNG